MTRRGGNTRLPAIPDTPVSGARAPGTRTPVSGVAAVLVPLLVPILLPLAGCSGPGVRAAPQARDPACETALGRLPTSLLGQARGSTDVAGVGIFGDPQIVVRCGVTPLGPTTLPCLTVNEVDWVIDDRADPLVFTTFGRSPSLEVRIPASYPRDGDPAALVDLQPAALSLPKTSLRCIG